MINQIITKRLLTTSGLRIMSLQSALRESFKEFRQRRLARTRGQRCSERILQEAIQTSPGFRRKLAGLLPSPTPYMDATSRRKNEEVGHVLQPQLNNRRVK